MIVDKRKLLGPAFGPLSRAKHSRASRYLVATACLPFQVMRARRNRPYFAVDISSPKGLGALLSEAILVCHHAQTHGLIPHIVSSNPLYAHDPGQDFLSHYLGAEERSVPAHVRPMKFRTLESFYLLGFARHLSLASASRLLREYLAPKAAIVDSAKAVLRAAERDSFDLSLHYRATDKVLEAPAVRYDDFVRAILDRQAAGCCIEHVFLATDDAAFDAWIRAQFPHIVFSTFNLGIDVDASRGRHFSDMDPAQKATEALVNMLLLSMAPTCIRSSSYLSAISKIMNPNLRTVTLNRDHWGSRAYPEFEILAEEAAHAVRSRGFAA
jgi:hypothetical protein